MNGRPTSSASSLWKSTLPSCFPAAASFRTWSGKPATDLLQSVLRTMRDGAQMEREKQGLQRITVNVGQVERFREALLAFAKEFPDTARANDFATAAGESRRWQGLLAWCELFETYDLDKPETLTPEKATEILRKGEMLLEQFGDSPLAEHFQSRKEFLTRIGSRLGFDRKQSIYNELIKYLAQAANSNLFLVQTRSGKLYYLHSDPRSSKELSEPKAKRLRIPRIDSLRGDLKTETITRQDVAYAGRAPHCELASGFVSVLRASDRRGVLNSSDWGPVFQGMLEDLAEAAANRDPATQPDPIKLAEIYGKVLKTAAEGSLIFEEAFKGHRRIFETIPIDPLVKWYRPGDDQAEALRKKLRSMFQSLPSKAQTGLWLAAARKKFLAPLPTGDYRWVGWLRKRAGDEWTLESSEAIDRLGDGELCVLNATKQGKLLISPVATMKESKIEWNQLNKDARLEGRPLFLRLEPKPPSLAPPTNP